jgi:hypothetical protein
VPDAAPLPAVGEDARFVPHEELRGAPHVVVDGPRLPGTVLALSHWPEAGTPHAVAADTSALIVDRYLELPHPGPPVDALTNNHFDEDGLFALWLLLERPGPADPTRALAVAAAEAGDFRTWADPWAARCALAAMAMAERPTTPFPAVLRALSPEAARDPAGAIYRALLPHVGRLLRDPARYERLWGSAWARVEADVALLDAGDATVEEAAEVVDVAVVRAPRPLNALAVYPRIRSMQVLTASPDGGLVLEHRYETWVRYVSRPLPPRVDLTPLLPRLQALERRHGTWRFDGVRAMTPRLYPAGPEGRPAPSSLGPERLLAELAAFVREARAA